METLERTSAIEDNIALVQRLYAAFGRGDLETIYAALAPDIRWEVTGLREDYPLFGPRRGIEGVKEFFETLQRTEDFSDFTPQEFHGSGDKVFILGHYAITVKTNGGKIDTDWCHVFTIRDGRVTAWREFTDTAQIAAANRG